MRDHALHILNSITRRKERFEPLNPPYVGLYVCGPTVYNEVHLGNVRTFISFDVVSRYLRFLGYTVRYVRNITDVGHLVNDADDGEDKVERMARLEDVQPMAIAHKYTIGFHDTLRTFNCIPPDIEPTASGHIIEQIEMVQRIIDNGYGYEVNGSVYFDVHSYNDDHPYGELSGRKIDELLAETRELEDQGEKRNPQDFAIWKHAGPEKIMKWNSPWGSGVPGWHLECSVMSTKYLGQTFDIHGGGMDLKFPHHECEIAQSVGADGVAPVRYWMHGNMLTVNGEKMSKSKGNSIMPHELISGDHELLSRGYSPMAIRFAMLQAHYGSEMDISDEALQAASTGYRRLMKALDVVGDLTSDGSSGTADEAAVQQCSACHAHMDDDFNTPKTLASLFELASIVHRVKDGHETLGDDALRRVQKTLSDFIHDVLGLAAEDASSDAHLPGVMDLVLTLRSAARNRKDWTTADLIRDRLGEAGIKVLDGADGSTWELEDT